ncbi:unnamed protein product, partial [Symbiodinium microadriaticum]
MSTAPTAPPKSSTVPVAPPPISRPPGMPSAAVLASPVILQQSMELLKWMMRILYSGKDEDWFENKDLAGPMCQEHILYEAWERGVAGPDGTFVLGEDCLADDLESFCTFVSENVPGLPSWETLTGEMLADTQLEKEDEQPASPPNKKQRPDETSTVTRASTELSMTAKSGSNLDFSVLHQELSPAGCSANAVASGSDMETAVEPSKGPVHRQASVTLSADAVRKQVAEQDGQRPPPILRKAAAVFGEQKDDKLDGLAAETPPVDAEALPQLPPEKMAKYDSWWMQWGRGSSRDSDATIASSATESDGTDVMQTVQQMAPGPLKSALLEVLMQKEPVPAEVQPRPEPVQAPSVPVQSPGVPVQAPAAPKVPVSPGLEPVPNRSGGDDRLEAFQKWVLSGGNGKAVEATMRLQRTSEEAHSDGGRYKPWASIVEHFKGDTDEALVFAQKRRQEERGTSTCRNTGVETFLLFDEESISWTTK